MKKVKPVITLGVLSMILTICISIQLKTIQAADIGKIMIMTDSNLKKSLLQNKSKNEKLNKELIDSDNELDDMRSKVTKIESDENIQNKMKNYEIMMGITDVSGEGIIINVADNTNIR